MERKEVIVSEQELARQKEFTRKMREMNDRRTRTPLALVDTFGCQQNVADGEVLMGMLREMGYELTRDENQADVILLNTCAIREHAEKRVYGHLGRLSHTKAAKPDQIICLCGCMAQQKVVADKVKNSYHHVDLVLGPQAEWRLPELLHEVYTKNKRVFSIENEHGRIAEDLPIVREGGVRAWVSIMYGCNNFCSYCIVPYVRGRERSREPEKIIEECRGLIAEGYKEITLLGQNVNSYGNRFGHRVRLCRSSRRHQRHSRRLLAPLYVEPAEGRDQQTFRHDGTLRARCKAAPPPRPVRVRPRSESDEPPLYARKVRGNDRLRAKRHARHGAHERRHHRLPGRDRGRSDADCRSCRKDAVRRALHLYFLPASRARPAAKMPDPVSREEKQVWFEKLVDAQNAISAKKHAAYIGRTVKVLVDGESDDEAFPLAARTEGNRLVRMKGDKALIGTFAKAKITDSNTWALYGEAVEE